MKIFFTPSKIEIIFLQREDIISTSLIPEFPEDEENIPKDTIGSGGDIGLPFDPFSLD